MKLRSSLDDFEIQRNWPMILNRGHIEVDKSVKIPSVLLGRYLLLVPLTHWDRVTYICVSNLTIIGSDNGLSSGRRQDIIWTNARILLTGPLGTNFSEVLVEIGSFSFKEMHFKNVVRKLAAICRGLNELITTVTPSYSVMKVYKQVNTTNNAEQLFSYWLIIWQLCTKHDCVNV